MSTQKWTRFNYLNHVVNNVLDNIWSGWCNPVSVDGIRISAYTPLYPESGNTDIFTRKCQKKNCDGHLVIPEEDILKRVIYRKVCDGIINDNKCNRSNTIIYRWISGSDKTKLWFINPNIVRMYAQRGRAFYATNIIYDKEIIRPKYSYIHEEFMNACTLYMDFDIKSGYGTICDLENRVQLNKAVSIARDELDTFAPGSYNLQTSGNGVYIMLHHKLVMKDIMNTMAKFNAWIIYLNNILKTQHVNRVKIDAINMPSRVFKSIGSLHQKHDLVCIPLEHDCDISNMSSGDFKINNFDMNNYFDNGKLCYYDRVDVRDIKGLYSFLEEHVQRHLNSDLRAVRYNYKDAIESITDNCETVDEAETERIIKEANQFIEDHVMWKDVDLDISGRAVYKKNSSNDDDEDYEIELLGVKKEDVKNMISEVIKKIGD